MSAEAGCADLLCLEAVCRFNGAPSRGKGLCCNINAMLSGAQGKFRNASAGVVAAADCNSVSVGMDSGHYEGPLRVRLPVKLSPSSSAEGAWSFVVPLPDPASQKLLSRSVNPAPLSSLKMDRHPQNCHKISIRSDHAPESSSEHACWPTG